MALALAIPREFGYVLLTAGASTVLHHVYMSAKVGQARKLYNVKYPKMYLDDAEPNAVAYNCVQRGMQNSLETLPTFNTLLLLTGLRYPIAASITGAVYLLGRYVYFRGYSSGEAKARLRGSFFWFAILGQLGMLAAWAVELLKMA